MVHGALRWLLRDYLRATLLSLARDYGLEPIALLPTDAEPAAVPADAAAAALAEPAALRAFVCRALRGLASAVPEDVAAAAAAAASAPGTLRVSCEPGAVAPSLPLFAQIFAPLQHLTTAAVSRALAEGGSDGSAGAVVRAAYAILAGESGLSSLVRSVEGSPPVFRRFARDVLALKLGFGRGRPPEEMRALVELALLLLRGQWRAEAGALSARGGSAGVGAPADDAASPEDALEGLSCVRLLLLQRDACCMAALAQVSKVEWPPSPPHTPIALNAPAPPPTPGLVAHGAPPLPHRG